MSTWDTDSQEERLRRLLEPQGPPPEPDEAGLPWFWWILQASIVGMVWILAVSVGKGVMPAWLGGAGVLTMAVALWMLEEGGPG